MLEALNECCVSSIPVRGFKEVMDRLWHHPTGEGSNEVAQSRIRKAIDQLIVKYVQQTFLIGTHGNIFTLWLQSYDSSYSDMF